MRENKLTISVNRPMHELYDFVINPENTPLWVDGIVREETDKWPTKLGTRYRNQNAKGEWSEYEITEFVLGNSFVLSEIGGNFHIRYTLKSTGDNKSELEYYEWVTDGEMSEPFTQGGLDKIKALLETPRRYVIVLKSGEQHVTGRFEDDEAVLRWINTGAASILYGNKNVPIRPENIQSIHPIDNAESQ